MRLELDHPRIPIRERSLLNILVAEGRQGLLALPGDTLLHYRGKAVLVRNGASK